MHGEFGSVVEGQGLAQGSGNLSEHRDEPLGGSLGLPVWRVVDHEVAALPLMGHEDVVAVFGEQHEIGFPMPRLTTIRRLDGPFADGTAALDVACGTTAAFAEASAAGLGAGQQAMPVIFLGRAMIDEAVD